MSPQTALDLAQVVLAAHLLVAGFIVFGLVAIPVGAAAGWQFVYGFWWRLLHLIAISAVAVQKLLGNSCFLTTWEIHLVDIARQAPHPTPFFQAFGERILYVDLPLWFFSALYSALWLFVLFMWLRVPPRLRGQARTHG